MRIDRRTLLRASAASAGTVLAPRTARATPGASLLTAAELREDLGIVVRAYRELHPGLDRYLGRERFAALAAAEERRLVATAADRRALFVALARLTAAVRCGHSYPNPVNQSDATRASLLDGRDRVPFAFRWIGTDMIVTRALTADAGLKPGDIVAAVDGVESAALLARLLPLARADGANDGKRRALMSVDGQGRYGAFDVYRPLIAPTRPDGQVALRVRGRTLMVPAMSDAERQAVAPGRAIDGGWRFDIAGGTGILTMPTWALYNSTWDWRGFIRDAIQRLVTERARGLVIDLRVNEGGLDCGNQLLAHLIDRPLALPAFERRVRYRAVPGDLRPHLDTWDKSFLDWGDAARPSGHAGFFPLVRDAADLEAQSVAPARPHFGGKVAVLISATCSSATFQFAQTIKGSGRAILVGETTGGNRRGINGGAYVFVRLPHSALEVDLPLIGYFPRAPQPDAGVVPDVPVALTRADIVAGRDPALVAAVRAVG